MYCHTRGGRILSIIMNLIFCSVDAKVVTSEIKTEDDNGVRK